MSDWYEFNEIMREQRERERRAQEIAERVRKHELAAKPEARKPATAEDVIKQFEKMFEDFFGVPKERDTDPAPGPEHEPPRFPTTVGIGLGEALDAVERVTTWAQQGKHQGAKWSTQTEEHQVGKMLGHLARGMKGETVDEDTGEHPYAHVAARALMLLGLVLQQPERCLVAREATDGEYYCTRADGHGGTCAAVPHG